MISSKPTTTTAANQLLESDAAYFELGADVYPLEAASLTCMPEFAPLHAACVVQRLQPSRIRSPVQWLVKVEREIAARGFNKARIYVTERGPALEAALTEAGFRPRIEYGFLFKRAPQPATEQVTLREVLTEADWRAKTRLHCEADLGSDGYRSDGALWTELVRAKCATGGMRSFLIEQNGEVCGSIGMVELSEVIRLKNLLISGGKKRRGLGSSSVRTVARLAAAAGKPAGIFAVESGPGEATYRSLGMEVVTQHTEWTKQL